MSIVSERTDMENKIVKYICSHKKGECKINIQKGYNGRILSFSPYATRTQTNCRMDIEPLYKYSQLSRKIHNSERSERSKIERKIKEIIPIEGQYTHLVFNEYFEHYRSVIRYCNEYDIPLITKEQYNRVMKLIKKWKIESQKEHYKLSQQEKRKLKKLSTQYKDNKVVR